MHNGSMEPELVANLCQCIKKDQITCIENDYDSSFKFKGQPIKRIYIADKNT